MGPRLTAVAAAALVGTGLGGCGSGASVSGQAVFAGDCAVCHSISGRSTPSQQGGGLRQLHLPREELVQYTAEMPVVNRPLARAQVRAVVAYVRSVERRR